MKIIELKETLIKEYSFPSELKEKLKGKKIRKQLEHFRCTRSAGIANITAFDKPVHNRYQDLVRIEDLKELLAVVIDDGIVVGIKVKCSGSEEICMLDKRICIYFASDNNGAGYKTYSEYLYLVSIQR